jgi:hypothetical protein
MLYAVCAFTVWQEQLDPFYVKMSSKKITAAIYDSDMDESDGIEQVNLGSDFLGSADIDLLDGNRSYSSSKCLAAKSILQALVLGSSRSEGAPNEVQVRSFFAFLVQKYKYGRSSRHKSTNTDAEAVSRGLGSNSDSTSSCAAHQGRCPNSVSVSVSVSVSALH